MKKFTIAILTLALMVTLVSCGGSSKGKTLATVGGKDLTEGDLEFLGNINPRLKAQMATEFGKKKILDNLIEQELLYMASKKEGLHRSPDVQNKIELYKKVIISQAYMDDKIKEQANEYYEKNKSDYEKLKLSHIAIKYKGDKNKDTKRSEKEALDKTNEIIAEINGGKDFAEVAKVQSEDTITNKRGGDLGFASKNEARLVRKGLSPVLEKAFTMKVGEISGPIKTDGAYHIVVLTQGSELQPFDKVAQSILFKIRADSKNKIMKDLKEKYKVTYADASKPKMKKMKKQKIEMNGAGKKKMQKEMNMKREMKIKRGMQPKKGQKVNQ